MKERYGITLEVVGMNIEEILAKLAGEKEAGSAAGSIDMIWINGENFYSAKENGLLYGAFLDKLPNTGTYIDTEDPETLNDFCMPIEGYEAVTEVPRAASSIWSQEAAERSSVCVSFPPQADRDSSMVRIRKRAVNCFIVIFSMYYICILAARQVSQTRRRYCSGSRITGS